MHYDEFWILRDVPPTAQSVFPHFESSAHECRASNPER
jgi:hypothetical protein